MDWLDSKLKKWERVIEAAAGEAVRREVMTGVEVVPAMEPKAMALWTKGAMERLSRLVTDLELRRRILVGFSCEHTEEFGEEPTRRMRDLYRETGSVEAVLGAMRADRSWNGISVYPPYELIAGELHVTKQPCDRAAFAKAKTDYEKQIAGCYCPLVKHTEEEIPEPYCYCGGGWHLKIWEGILERPVRIEVTKAILRGDKDCSFIIRYSE
ncbi:hypothetical protein K8R78_00075 [bacterium]|nr:hypothetical protein [bacterium]